MEMIATFLCSIIAMTFWIWPGVWVFSLVKILRGVIREEQKDEKDPNFSVWCLLCVLSVFFLTAYPILSIWNK